MNQKIEDIKLSELTDPSNLKDPTFWGCCLLPSLMVTTVVIGLFYRFILWAFFS
ncbi:MAG: hypothetical protein MN733_30225 [Nitrososphaera sp.]|nr:hypothetical protein [Nitrososphaera sp.]